eukprot:gene10928-12735_t
MSSLLRIGKIVPETTALCDLQVAFKNVIHGFPKVVHHTNTIIKCSKELKIPILGTEQYPQGLGKLVDELNPSSFLVLPKTLFSMCTPDVMNTLKSPPFGNIKSIVITGIETHVCVLQTTLDLLDSGYDVHVVEDAVSSQNLSDKVTAIERLRQSGAYITSTESIIFQLTKDAKNKNFKSIANIIKEQKELYSKL